MRALDWPLMQYFQSLWQHKAMITRPELQNLQELLSPAVETASQRNEENNSTDYFLLRVGMNR